ncbi:MAG: protein-L-isoaspartate(D-aspartate) O-methyltransferase [Elusimicrobia bacterium]|nr:protein-L-isoaspartate(D-aspartate) O-methyltransferase [Elusimicrobiota bacterium]
MTADPWKEPRERMIREQIEARGVRAPAVLTAMKEVPRHLFVGSVSRDQAYEDRPVPIGLDQTISQPFIVAYMLERLLAPDGKSQAGLGTPDKKVLEIGTGSGYQTALLSRLVKEVFTVEVEPLLSERVKALLLEDLKVPNVHFRVGDGLSGWPEAAPFDRIVLTAAVDEVPRELLNQLGVSGVCLAPVGPPGGQKLIEMERTRGGFETRELMDVLFVQAHDVPAALYRPMGDA